jgi:hypothetical protein
MMKTLHIFLVTFLVAPMVYAQAAAPKDSAKSGAATTAPAPSASSKDTATPSKDAATSPPAGNAGAGAPAVLVSPEVTTATSTPPAPAKESEMPTKEPLFDIGVGILGGGGIVAIEKPSDNPTSNVIMPGIPFVPQYPGYFGPKVGGGVSVDAKFFGAVGIEIDILRLDEKGSADVNGKKTTIEQTAWHFPIYLKGTLPIGPVRPFLGIGPEPVLGVSSYLLWGAMIGAEGRIVLNKKFSLTIPVSLRYAHNFGLGDKYADRYTNILGITVPTTDFQHNAMLTLGVSFHYSL